jgi:hypothetical protein
MVPSPEDDMSDEPPPGPRGPRIPFKDRLGELCESGRESTAYLWQVPDDESVRRKIAGLLTEIKAEAAKGGRKEMGRLAVEILQDGFDRLTRLWGGGEKRPILSEVCSRLLTRDALSRTSCAAASMSRPRLNFSVMLLNPS